MSYRKKLIAWLAGAVLAWTVSFVIVRGPVLAGIAFGLSHGASVGLLGGIADLLLPYEVAPSFFDGPMTLYVLLMAVVGGCMQWLFKRLSGDVSWRAGALAAAGWSAIAALSPIGTYIVRYIPHEPLPVIVVAFIMSAAVSFLEAFVMTGVLGQLIAVPFLRGRMLPDSRRDEMGASE